MFKKYRKKPVVVEAIKYDGTNAMEIYSFCNGEVRMDGSDELFIETLEGRMTALVGDYIIRGVKGEYYPCKPDIFEQTYEEVEE